MRLSSSYHLIQNTRGLCVYCSCLIIAYRSCLIIEYTEADIRQSPRLTSMLGTGNKLTSDGMTR